MISIGKEYSYKQLCEDLGEPIMKGKSRTLQVNRWKKMFQIEKTDNGKKYVLIRAYTDDERKILNVKGKYLHLFAQTVTNMCLERNLRPLLLTLIEIMYRTGMVNQNYKDLKIAPDEYAAKYNIDRDVVRIYKTKSFTMLCVITKKMLLRLDEEGIIKCEPKLKFYYFTDSGDFRAKTCSPKEEKDIIEMRKRNLKKVGLEEFNELYYNVKKKQKFQRLFNEDFKKKYWKYVGVYTTYRIQFLLPDIKGFENDAKEQLGNLIYEKIKINKLLEL